MPPKPLPVDRLKVIHSSEANICNRLAATLPPGTPFTAALDPSFWSNVGAMKLHIGDTVEIHSESRSFFGTIYVRDLTKTRAFVGKLDYVEFGAIAQSAESVSHRVEYLGLHLKWGIRRLADGKVVRESLESKEAAELALQAMERSQTKAA